MDITQDVRFDNSNAFFAGIASVGITQSSQHSPYQVFFIGAVTNAGVLPKRPLTTPLVTTESAYPQIIRVD